MKTPITCLLILLLAYSVHAQTLYVGCKRSIDNARIQADSIRVVCVELRIDSTVRGSEFTLPTTTGVHDDGYTGHGEAIEADLYDVLGRYVGRASMQATANCLQWDATHGLVIVRTLGKHNQRSGQKGDAEILGTRNFTITAWRAGYEAATVTRKIQYYDVEVPIVLELLPWWKRIRSVTLTAQVPRSYYSGYGSSGHGGTYSSWSVQDTLAHTFHTAVWVISDSAFRTWNWNDTAATYTYMGPGWFRPILNGKIYYDPTGSMIKEISLFYYGDDDSNTDTDLREEIIVQNLPALESQTVSKLKWHLVGAVANNCVRLVSRSEDWRGDHFDSSHKNYGPHIPYETGAELICEIALLD